MWAEIYDMRVAIHLFIVRQGSCPQRGVALLGHE
jgi:hypothetical protein